jgi:hypothetical protein
VRKSYWEYLLVNLRETKCWPFHQKKFLWKKVKNSSVTLHPKCGVFNKSSFFILCDAHKKLVGCLRKISSLRKCLYIIWPFFPPKILGFPENSPTWFGWFLSLQQIKPNVQNLEQLQDFTWYIMKVGVYMFQKYEMCLNYGIFFGFSKVNQDCCCGCTIFWCGLFFAQLGVPTHCNCSYRR